MAMEESSEVLDSVVNPEPQRSNEDQDEQYHSDESEVSQPEILAEDLKELTLSPSTKKPSHRPVRPRPGRRVISTKIKPVENKREIILRKVQSAFPRRQVRTLLSVQKDPVARMKRFIRIEKKLRSRNGDVYEEGEPFRCLCTFCLYQGWDPSENAKIGKD
ncbi:developmental pluripotency-associated protein 3-like [Mesocricetus auratus]|uniref:Developmental pluripotency-associated protein 3-like n=1 Tax=Mesocricetus auratus TaxID=10036 RepID=A0ABM2WMQ1_MESAU|nr:developmental pluripotency-associated protein 3-like [Mesocricetus auratus]